MPRQSLSRLFLLRLKNKSEKPGPPPRRTGFRVGSSEETSRGSRQGLRSLPAGELRQQRVQISRDGVAGRALGAVRDGPVISWLSRKPARYRISSIPSVHPAEP